MSVYHESAVSRDHAMNPHRKAIPDDWFGTNEDGGRSMYVMAPMVGQSDLPFRMLVRKYGGNKSSLDDMLFEIQMFE
jgi:hypothetical protein